MKETKQFLAFFNVGEVIELGKPFKDLEEVKTDIRMCDWAASIFGFASLVFAALGVIGDAFDVTLVLESMSWFLLVIVVGLYAILLICMF